MIIACNLFLLLAWVFRLEGLKVVVLSGMCFRFALLLEEFRLSFVICRSGFAAVLGLSMVLAAEFCIFI